MIFIHSNLEELAQHDLAAAHLTVMADCLSNTAIWVPNGSESDKFRI